MQFLQCRKSFSTRNISFLDVKFFLTLYIRVLLSFLFLRLPICLKFGDFDFGIIIFFNGILFTVFPKLNFLENNLCVSLIGVDKIFSPIALSLMFSSFYIVLSL